MVSKVQINLDSAGIQELLKSEEVFEFCENIGNGILARCGSDYKMEEGNYVKRRGVKIQPSNIKGLGIT